MLGWAQAHVIDIGTLVNGKYKLTRLLGDGGMGSVYEANHAVLGTRVAIKVLHPELARRGGLVERFLQEARVAAQIRSPHVVQVTDVDRTPDGHAYIVMELLEGEPLSSVLDRQRKLPIGTATEYGAQILEALEAAHALGVIHRDLKPENVFVTFAGGRPVLKLIDFGIAKARRTDPQQRNLTVAGVVMGTAEYMAPEQARSADKVDARSDLYAVGVMIYEMISGVRPVTGEDARIIALKVERGEAVPLVKVAPDVPREIAGLVHRAMAPRPELRFSTATEMRLAVLNATSGAGRRPATAGMHAAPAGSVAPAPPAAAPSVDTGPSGTLKGAKAAEVMAAAAAARAKSSPPPRTPAGPAPGGGAEGDRPADTVRAPPVATALTPTPAVYGGAVMPAATGERPRARRGNRGTVAALVALSLLLGAGVVAIIVMQNSSNAGPTQPVDFSQTSAPEAGVVAPGTTPTAPPNDTIPSLNTGTGPGPHPIPSGHPGPTPTHSAGEPDSGGLGPPFPIPSNLPPFPSNLPPFPSVLPPWPSGFIPPWPTSPPPPAPPHSGKEI
jgi:tRNA A-37 threonylcarbamoyl transferase component Bud32